MKLFQMNLKKYYFSLQTYWYILEDQDSFYKFLNPYVYLHMSEIGRVYEMKIVHPVNIFKP